MPKLVSLTIDGRGVEVPEGTLIVDAAKKIGIDIPVFCYHPKMEPVGMCRMCLVDVGRPVRDRNTGEWVREPDGSLKIQFSPKLETACTTPVSEGMVVLGLTDKVKAARKDVLEFLLTSHPLDCPICDKGGECPLQNLTMEHGPGQSRFIYDEKYHLAKHVPLGELIILDRERCIQCGRCVRFQDQLVGEPVIGFYQRGRALEIVTFSDPGFDSYFSGNTSDICPVGALTTADFRFEARPWEMKSAASICPHCPVGCNLTLNVRREARAGGEIVVKRVMPRQNELVNEIWICDKGRFAHHFAQSSDRLDKPLVRKGDSLMPVEWDEVLDVVAEHFHAAGSDLFAFVGGRLANEDLFNLSKLVKGLGADAALYSRMAGGELIAKVGVGQGTNFSDMGSGTAILVVSSDLQEESPIWWLRVKQAVDRGATLIVVNPRPTKLDRYARHQVRYPYGSEAVVMQAMGNALSAKRPELAGKPLGTGLMREVEAAAQAFSQAENGVILFGSEGIGLEASQALAQACANLLVITNHTGRPNNGLVAVWPEGNTQGAWDIGFAPLADLETGIQSAKALYIVGADPVGDNPALAQAIRSVGFVLVQELFLTETAKLADVVLPAQAFTEREGTYTSGERRVQRFYPAIPSRPGTLPDFVITSRIGERLGMAIEGRSAVLVMNQIAADLPDYKDVSYQKLAEVKEQWPIVGRQDLYYGGTTYENRQGMGVQLMPAAQRGEAASLAWVQPVEIPTEADSLLAVPVTRLYDRGRTVTSSKVLMPRIPEPYVCLHPSDGQQLGIQDGEKAILQWKGNSGEASFLMQVEAVVLTDASVPAGIILVPRSMGIPIFESVPVNILQSERVTG